MTDRLLDLMVKGREGVAFEGKVESVTAKNSKGEFDILPSHGNFITLLDQTLRIKKQGGETQEIPVSEGVLKVTGDKVSVYLGVRVGK